MRLSWVTDIHLNFCDAAGVTAFCEALRLEGPDAVLVGGDIGEAPDVCEYLEELEQRLERPVYFVLGNHDFYHGVIAGVRAEVRELARRSRHLVWLDEAGAIPLTAGAALVGAGGWGDGRLGDYARSEVFLNDYRLIAELSGIDHRTERLRRLRRLGEEAAAHLRNVLAEALEGFEEVLVLTHVPPFREACWHQGRVSGDDFLPHFACGATGEVLATAAAAHPDRRLTVLCGHTHGAGEVSVLPNLRVITGGVRYGYPELQRSFDIQQDHERGPGTGGRSG